MSENPLIDAVFMKEDLEAARKLLDENPARVNDKDAYGHTALALAVTKVNTDMVELLLSRGADPNLAGADGSVPITIPVFFLQQGRGARDLWPGITRIVALLLDNGAKADGLDHYGEKPLIKVVEKARNHEVHVLFCKALGLPEPAFRKAPRVRPPKKLAPIDLKKTLVPAVVKIAERELARFAKKNPAFRAHTLVFDCNAEESDINLALDGDDKPARGEDRFSPGNFAHQLEISEDMRSVMNPLHKRVEQLGSECAAAEERGDKDDWGPMRRYVEEFLHAVICAGKQLEKKRVFKKISVPKGFEWLAMDHDETVRAAKKRMKG